jgi:beta-phosphoglucomutase-like phosphatase (HAD superfamily)
MLVIMISAVIFDMDGLMLDTESINRRTWQAAADELGYPLDDEFYMTLLGRTTVDCEACVRAQCGEAFPMETFRARRRELWRAQVDAGGIVAKAGLVDLLGFLALRRVPIAVATSSHTAAAESSLRSAGIRDRFDIIVTGDQVTNGKPAPDIYLEAARRLDMAPQRCLALEDSDNGVQAAHAAGMLTLMVPDLKPPSAESIARAYQVVPSLTAAREIIAEILALPNVVRS